MSRTSYARSESRAFALKPPHLKCWPPPLKASRAPSIRWLVQPGSKQPKRTLFKFMPVIWRARWNWFRVLCKCAKTPPLMTEFDIENWPQSVRELHKIYCHWTAQNLTLRFDRGRLWYEFL